MLAKLNIRHVWVVLTIAAGFIGPASSPIIWNGLVIVQCDTQTDSFLLALNAETGETVWKTDRQELPSWGTPTIVNTTAGPELVTNASNFVRGYDPVVRCDLS